MCQNVVLHDKNSLFFVRLLYFVKFFVHFFIMLNNFVIVSQLRFWRFPLEDYFRLHMIELLANVVVIDMIWRKSECLTRGRFFIVFPGRHPELSSPSHLSHPSAAGNNGRIPGLFSHFYDGQRQPSHFPRTSGKNKFCCYWTKTGIGRYFKAWSSALRPILPRN